MKKSGIISKEGKIGYIMGDFNINLLNYEKHKPTGSFLKAMYNYSHSFVPLITKPTRITTHTATLIDNIFTNNTSTINQHYPGISYNDISDHLPVFCFNQKIKVQNIKIVINKRQYTTKNMNKFHNIIQEIDWSFLQSITDPQTAYTDIFQKQHDHCFPLKPIEIKVIKQNLGYQVLF